MAAQSKTTSRNSSVTADRAASAKAEPHVASSILEDLPSPDELAKYEKIVPGGAERLRGAPLRPKSKLSKYALSLGLSLRLA